MTQRMKDIAEEIVRLQGELDREIEARRKALGWELRERIGEFEMGVAAQHRSRHGARFGGPGWLPRAPGT